MNLAVLNSSTARARDIHQSASIAIEKIGHARAVLDELFRYLEEAKAEALRFEAPHEYISATQAIHVALFELANIESLVRS